jgi:hypothetical protein
MPSVICALIGHAWRGRCVCARCKTRRDTGHSFAGCTCSVCGKTNHDWRGSCTCGSCGAKRKDGHELSGTCKCRLCGQEVHDEVLIHTERVDETSYSRGSHAQTVVIHYYEATEIQHFKCRRCRIEWQREARVKWTEEY